MFIIDLCMDLYNYIATYKKNYIYNFDFLHFKDDSICNIFSKMF
jgi:hypothetical protein